MYSLNAFSLLLLTLNAPIQIGKCTPGPRGTCTSGWEPLFQTKDPCTQATKINQQCMLSQNTQFTICNHGRLEGRTTPFLDFEICSKKYCYFSYEWEKTNSSTFGPALEKRLEKSVSASPLEKNAHACKHPVCWPSLPPAHAAYVQLSTLGTPAEQEHFVTKSCVAS